MLKKLYDRFRNSNELDKAIAISIIVGICITLILIMEIREERFSQLYIYPESYTNFPEGNTISFIYGVKSYEKQNMSYDLEIFIGNKLMDRRNLTVQPGKTYEEKVELDIPDVSFPIKVNLILNSSYNTYDTHYWLKKPEKTPEQPPIPTPELTPTPTPMPALSNTTLPTPTPALTNIAVPTPPMPSNTTAYVPVRIDSRLGFSPKEVSIKPGNSVRWVNYDGMNRDFTLVSQEGLFTTLIKLERRFEYSFNTTGTFTFYLKEYPNVKGTVTVS